MPFWRPPSPCPSDLLAPLSIYPKHPFRFFIFLLSFFYLLLLLSSFSFLSRVKKDFFHKSALLVNKCALSVQTKVPFKSKKGLFPQKCPLSQQICRLSPKSALSVQKMPFQSKKCPFSPRKCPFSPKTCPLKSVVKCPSEDCPPALRTFRHSCKQG